MFFMFSLLFFKDKKNIFKKLEPNRPYKFNFSPSYNMNFVALIFIKLMITQKGNKQKEDNLTH